MSAPDHITVLRTKGLPATKTIGAGPDARPAIISSYGMAKRFSIRQEPVTGLASLAQVLDRIRWDEFVIRGEPLEGADLGDCVRRLHPDPLTGEKPTFREMPRRWLLLDFDNLPGPYVFDVLDGELAAEFARSHLTTEFHRTSCWWQLTSGAGIKPGVRLRLAFWLDRAVDKPFLDRWLAGAPVDRTVFGVVQAVYCARPVFDGVVDHIPIRTGILEDPDQLVRVPSLPAEVPKVVSLLHSPAGKRYVSGLPRSAAARRLRPLCDAVARAKQGDRHRCLMWASARAVELDDAIPRAEIAAELLAAARQAGLDEPEQEIERQIKNGFKLGIFGSGAPL